MKQQKIKNELIAWFKIITSRFQWISVKYEYSDKLKSFLVSFSPSDKINESDEFCIEAMRFENEMNEKYGDNAPLFCDDEKYFTLSEHSEIINFDKNNTIDLQYNVTESINYSKFSYYLSNWKQGNSNNKYSLAA